ncbi:hypothetical protein SDC9_198980 [bioreactor metagenome]|uniref:Uncharacterized protein n=1 Tax=bioreactor metagenome TaxID=1076179 RepID=A0A645IJ74_9ZZZZ
MVRTVELNGDLFAVEVFKAVDALGVLVEEHRAVEGEVPIRKEKVLLSLRRLPNAGQHVDLAVDRLIVSLRPGEPRHDHHIQAGALLKKRDVVRRNSLIRSVQIDEFVRHEGRVNTQPNHGMLPKKRLFLRGQIQQRRCIRLRSQRRGTKRPEQQTHEQHHEEQSAYLSHIHRRFPLIAAQRFR